MHSTGAVPKLLVLPMPDTHFCLRAVMHVLLVVRAGLLSTVVHALSCMRICERHVHIAEMRLLLDSFTYRVNLKQFGTCAGRHGLAVNHPPHSICSGLACAAARPACSGTDVGTTACLLLEPNDVLLHLQPRSLHR